VAPRWCDANIWFSLKNDESNIEEIQQTWAASIDDDSLGVVEIRLVPIWTLLDHDDMDRAKARELQGFFTKKWEAESDKLVDQSPKVPCEDTVKNPCTAHPINLYQPSCDVEHGEGYEGINWEHCDAGLGGRYICRKKFTCEPGSVCSGGGCAAR